MTKKYIDANPLIERLKKLATTSLFNKTIYAFIVNMLAEQPAIDVQEVRHGKWEIDCNGYYPYCSTCKEEPANGVMSDYCPNCGARMDGETNE